MCIWINICNCIYIIALNTNVHLIKINPIHIWPSLGAFYVCKLADISIILWVLDCDLKYLVNCFIFVFNNYIHKSTWLLRVDLNCDSFGIILLRTHLYNIDMICIHINVIMFVYSYTHIHTRAFTQITFIIIILIL